MQPIHGKLIGRSRTGQQGVIRLRRKTSGFLVVLVLALGMVAVGGGLNSVIAGANDGERRVLAPGDEPSRASRILAQTGLPVQPMRVAASLRGLNVFHWQEGEVHRLMFDGWVEVQIGSYSFNAKRAVAWIHQRRAASNVKPAQGETGHVLINEIAIYFEGISAADQASGVSASGNDLLVTATTIGEVALLSDAYHEGEPSAQSEFLQRGENRFLHWLNRAMTSRGGGGAGSPVILDRQQQAGTEPIDEDALKEYFATHQGEGQGGKAGAGESGRKEAGGAGVGNQASAGGVGKDGGVHPSGYWTGKQQTEGAAQGGGAAPTGGAELPPATVFFRADSFRYQFAQDKSEGYATLTGHLVIQYTETARRQGETKPRQLTLHADRAVVFTDPISPEDMQMQQVSAKVVRGVYLEGDVTATDGSYTLRGPRMYYEFNTNKAIVLNGVFSSYDRKVRVPIYVRAETIRQTAADAWEAKGVTISTSEFFTPTVSLGAGTARLVQKTDADTGETSHEVTVKSATMRIGNTPFFWWPFYRGEVTDFPLRRLSMGGSRNDGFTVKTKWNLFGLAGKEPPKDVDANLLIDYYAERGVGLGGDISYKTKNGRGRWNGYFINDSGTDRLSSGVEIQRDNQTRGNLIGFHKQRLGNDWTLLLEGAFASDEAFMDSYFDRQTEAHREFQTRLLLQKIRGNTETEILTKYAVNDFLINQDLLEAQTYQVDKLPELGYYRYADDLFGGDVSYTSEYRLSRLRLRFPDHKLSDIGQGRVAFGLPPSTNLRDFFISQGLRETFTDRFFTRQELSMPMRFGSINVDPFVSGRFAFYDDDEAFRRFNSNADQSFYYLSTGVRLHTQISKVNDAIDNRLLDLHRLRHVIEPTLTLWHSESNADGRDYPVFDLDVEGVSTGSAVAFGLKNTWQTMRGGPGRWHSVDVLVLNSNLVFTGHETQDDFSIPRFFQYRPEFSRLGDHFQGDFKWLVSDSFAIAGDTVLDIKNGDMARGNIGFRIDHDANLFSFVDYRVYDFNSDNLVDLGLGYTITPTYRVNLGASYDIDRKNARNVYFAMNRKMPQFDLGITANYDNIRGEATFGIVLSPKGAGGKRFGGIINPSSRRR